MTSRIVRVIGVAVGLVCVGALLLGPANGSAAAVGLGDSDRIRYPAATTVSSDCWGGPGRMIFTVHARAADNTYKLDVTSRRLVDGSRWSISLLSEQLPKSEPGVFHRRANDGGWTATIRLGPQRQEGLVYFEASAHERGVRHGCNLWTRLGSPAPRATAECGNADPFTGDERLAILAARRLDDARLELTFDLYEDRRPRLWHVRVTLREGGTSHTVAFEDRTNRRGHLAATVQLRGYDNPGVRVVATRSGSPRCSISLNPSNRL